MSSRDDKPPCGPPDFRLGDVGAFFLFVLLLLLALGTRDAAGSSPQQSSSNNRGRISGSVLNSVTHEPIARALVSSATQFGVMTDGEGRFQFILPEDASSETRYWLQVRKPGFLDDPNGRSNVEVSPGNEVAVYLVPEAIIKGRIMLSTAEPASGITVQVFLKQLQSGVYRWMRQNQVRSNSNGEFRFAELKTGTYKLLTSEFMDNDPITSIPGSQMFGFPPVYYPNATDFGTAGAIELTAGQIFEADVSLVRQPYYPVKIAVLNAEARQGLTITVTPRANRSPGYALGYNHSRQAIEGSLPNGTYLVEGGSFGQNPAVGAVTLTVAGAPAESGPMALGPGASITFRVKEEFTSDESVSVFSGPIANGRHAGMAQGPRRHLSVNAEVADDFERHQVSTLRQLTSPNDDSMVIEGLRSGSYHLQFYPSRGYVASATISGTDLLHQPITVAAGSNATVDVVMRDDVAELDVAVVGLGAAIAGSYAGVPGNASGNAAWIYYVPLADSPGRFQQSNVGGDGKVSLQNMVPGTYRVMALRSRSENIPYGDAEAMRAYESKGQVVHLSPGQKTNVQLQIDSDNE